MQLRRLRASSPASTLFLHKPPKQAQCFLAMEVKIDAAEFMELAHIGSSLSSGNPVFNALLALLATAVVTVFSLYTRLLFYLRQALYVFQREFVYSQRTPQSIRKDVETYDKVPRHIAFVLEKTPSRGIEGLVSQTLESASWCLGAGTPLVTIYERTGALKSVPLETLAEAVCTGLAQFFRDEKDAPSIRVRNGNHAVTMAGPGLPPVFEDMHDAQRSSPKAEPSLTINLASEQDGRPMMLTLAKEYAQLMAQGALAKSEITVDKIHGELCDRVGEEPDLLVTFGSRLDFAGFSPWLLRVTELFCLPDNNGVFHYLVFIKGLQKFANVKVNLGA